MSGTHRVRRIHPWHVRSACPRLLAAATFVALVAGLPAQGLAQVAGVGSVFGGLGAGLCTGCGTETILHLGGGGDLFITDRVAIGGDIGFIGQTDYLEGGLGLASINASYRFGQWTSRTRPFLTGGYSRLFRDGHLNALNFGAGLDRWLSGRLGVRVEFRDHIPAFSEGGFDAHVVDVRVGLILR